jgi:acetyl-CoA acetyltransferase
VCSDNATSGHRSFAAGATKSEPPDDNAAFGEFSRVAHFAMAARRGMHEFQTGPEMWKEIALNQRKWANLNPDGAFYKNPLTDDDYFNADWVVEPFRLYDCCIMSDEGRACIVTSKERARDLKSPLVTIMGLGEANSSVDIHQSSSMTSPISAQRAGAMAFDMAGITANDVDACEICYCFTSTVEITHRDYGFFKPGEGQDWFANGRTAPGSEIPVSTSGGLFSDSYCMSLTPVTEGVMQLRGVVALASWGATWGQRRRTLSFV